MLSAAFLSATPVFAHVLPKDCHGASEVELRIEGTEFDTIWGAALTAAQSEYDYVAKSYETGYIAAASSRSSVSPYDTEDVDICILHSAAQRGRFVVRVSQPGLPTMQLIGPNPSERIANRIKVTLQKPKPGNNTGGSRDFLPGPPPLSD
jgi:hypothetical protein